MGAKSRSSRHEWIVWWAAALALGAGPALAQEPPVCRSAWGAGPMRVACLGNSNTDSGWQFNREDGFPPEEAWCERLALETEQLNTRNCGWGGATAADNTTALPYFQGAGQLEAALSDPSVEIVILALGTNDIGYSLVDPDHLLLDPPTPAAIADVIATLAATVEAAGASVLVATTPYRLPPNGLPSQPEGINDLVDELNSELALRFEADEMIDFSTGFEPVDFFSDGTHMSSSGMAKRAALAREAVLHLVPEPDPRWTGIAPFLVVALRARAAARRRLSPGSAAADRRRSGR